MKHMNNTWVETDARQYHLFKWDKITIPRFWIDSSRGVCGTITHVYSYKITRLTLAQILLFQNQSHPSNFIKTFCTLEILIYSKMILKRTRILTNKSKHKLEKHDFLEKLTTISKSSSTVASKFIVKNFFVYDFLKFT